MKTKKLFLFSLLIISSIYSFGQIKNLGKPKSWLLKSDQTQLTTENMPVFDYSIYRSLDSVNDVQKNGPWRFGHKFFVNYSLNNSGVWTNLPNGDRIWRLKIKSRDALSLNFIFENLFIPEGATIYMHKPDKSSYLGAYTSVNNSESRILGTDLIMGESCIIEYYEPSAVYGQGSLVVSTIVHGYRNISLFDNNTVKALNDSGDCNRDIKCLTDPEPLWLNESKSVAMIVVNGNGACTGTLVNNTAQDGKAYFLTANHCYDNPATWAFRFKWISPTPDCATTANSPAMPSPTQFQTANGSVLRARNAGSDFCLVEITNLTLQTAQTWGLYYAGWDKTGAAVNGAVGIHHPSGDIMKYARENNALTQATFGGAQTWQIANWDEGVTEPGSSGSGLWDFNRRLIGQLYGGSAACTGTNDNNQPDFYGRLDISWNGTSAAARLRDWLDPTNSGVGVLDGYDPNAISANLDAGIQGISSINDSYCGTGVVSPAFTLVNVGNDNLTSAQIQYSFDGGAPQTFSWNGNLATNQTEMVQLPNSTLGNGPHTFVVTLISANGNTDENPLNNSSSRDFTIILNGEAVNLALTLDCWGSETTWQVMDVNSTIVTQGGPYSDDIGGEIINEQMCLNPACYTFTIFDSYGDGLNGASIAQCGIDGTYAISQNGDILASIIAANSDFGNEETNNFCVTPNLQANFEAMQPQICVGTEVSFNNTSVGTITSYEWTFSGGIPATSNEENPIVSYPNAGVYGVILTVSDGINSSTQTLNNFVTVSEVPATPTIITASGLNIVCSGSTLELISSETEGNVWSSGETTQSIFVNQEGFYSLTTVTNNCSSLSSNTFITSLSETPIIVESFENTSACGLSDGNVTINGTDVIGNLSWTGTSSGSMNNVQLPLTLNNLGAGSYSFEFDNNCFTSTISQIISETGAPAAPIISANGLTSLCSNDVVELTSNTANIVWNTGVTTQSIDVSTPGTYFVSLFDGLCTSVSNNIIVTQNPLSAAPTITTSGTTQICQGDFTELASSIAQGNLWSTGETAQIISVNQAGVYQLSYLDANNCMSEIASIEIIVNALPTAPTISANGATTFCQGGSVVLTSSQTNGNLWSNNQTTSSITVNQSGTFMVTFTDANSCQSNSNPIQIIVNALPNVNAGTDVQICNGQSVTLSGQGALTYSWNNGVTNGIAFNPSQTTLYTVTGTDNNSCSNTDQVLVTVNNFLSITFDDFAPICLQSADFTLNTANPTGGTYSGTGVTNNTFSPVNAGVGSHTITYSIISSGGCQSVETAQITVDDCSSINDVLMSDLTVFPNPFENELTIKLEGNFKFEIIDASGRLIHVGKGEDEVSLKTVDFNSGVYLLKISNVNATNISKIIKK